MSIYHYLSLLDWLIVQLSPCYLFQFFFPFNSIFICFWIWICEQISVLTTSSSGWSNFLIDSRKNNLKDWSDMSGYYWFPQLWRSFKYFCSFLHNPGPSDLAEHAVNIAIFFCLFWVEFLMDKDCLLFGLEVLVYGETGMVGALIEYTVRATCMKQICFFMQGKEFNFSYYLWTKNF